MAEITAEIITHLREYLYVLFVSMLPVIEVKGAIPLGIARGLQPAATFLTALVGSCLPAPFVILLFKPFLKWLRSLPFKICRAFADWTERHALKRKGKISNTSLIFLFIFVAIPLPGTGVWTGSMIAALLDIRLKRAIPAIWLGNVVASLLLLALGVVVF